MLFWFVLYLKYKIIPLTRRSGISGTTIGPLLIMAGLHPGIAWSWCPSSWKESLRRFTDMFTVGLLFQDSRDDRPDMPAVADMLKAKTCRDYQQADTSRYGGWWVVVGHNSHGRSPWRHSGLLLFPWKISKPSCMPVIRVIPLSTPFSK